MESGRMPSEMKCHSSCPRKFLQGVWLMWKKFPKTIFPVENSRYLCILYRFLLRGNYFLGWGIPNILVWKVVDESNSKSKCLTNNSSEDFQNSVTQGRVHQTKLNKVCQINLKTHKKTIQSLDSLKHLTSSLPCDLSFPKINSVISSTLPSIASPIPSRIFQTALRFKPNYWGVRGEWSEPEQIG